MSTMLRSEVMKVVIGSIFKNWPHITMYRQNKIASKNKMSFIPN